MRLHTQRRIFSLGSVAYLAVNHFLAKTRVYASFQTRVTLFGDPVRLLTFHVDEDPSDGLQPFLEFGLTEDLRLGGGLQRKDGQDPPRPGRARRAKPVVGFGPRHRSIVGGDFLLKATEMNVIVS